ncbi:MAG TPA: 2OG-Fe(II) oxygenase [Vicinamibacterales bacterium]|nr:2OG-Fe(II) oxygenase [Vicinamibacterales bacterium]
MGVPFRRPAGIELYVVEGVLTPRECDGLIALMATHLRPSTITVDDPDPHFRTSKTCDLATIDAPLVREVDARLCALLQLAPALGEAIQGQRYDVGDQFKPHTDYFEAGELERFSTPTLGQRTWTVMVYLNEPEAGGATEFPLVRRRIQPRTGRAVIWNNLLPDGRTNYKTLHAGRPVHAGFKAVITKWFRMPRVLASPPARDRDTA